MARLAGRNKTAQKSLRTAARSATSPDAVASVGVPTKVEFDRVVTLVNELKADHNQVVTDLRG